MYKLIQVSEQCYYINCPAKIGVYVPDKDNVYLIDSGNDKDAGRKVRQLLDKNGWNLRAILNTHSNADHIGGNRYLQGQTGCRVLRLSHCRDISLTWWAFGCRMGSRSLQTV